MRSDIDFVELPLKGETVYLLPDRLLICRGLKIGAVSNDEIQIGKRDYRFIESRQVPPDAHIIGYTWAKVNKDGSPDKRFKGNKQIPVCNYGMLTLKTATMDIRICCSNPDVLGDF